MPRKEELGEYWQMDELHLVSYYPALATGKSCDGSWPMLLASY